MSKSNKLNPILTRRDVLQYLGLAVSSAPTASPIMLLFESLLNGIVSKAYAAEGGTNPRNFLYIQQAGAPSRWTWDLFLTPYGTSNFQTNPMIGTAYTATGDRYTGVTYRTISAKGINVPYLWQFPVPAVGGGNRPMTDLLDNLICMRGMTTGNAGHTGSRELHFRPIGARSSITALSADNSNAPIPALQVKAFDYQFLSKKGKSSVQLGTTGNILEQLLNPFMVESSASYKSKKQSLNSAIETAMSALEAQAKSNHEASSILVNARTGAEELIHTGFNGLTQVWTGLVNKYTDLVTRAISRSNPIPGISDKPIGTTSTRDGKYNISGVINTTADLRDLITPTSRPAFMAQHFAVAEYVLLNRLSNSITISPRYFTGLLGGLLLPFDEHFSGSMPILYLNSMYNRALAACLLELIDKLKAANMWNDTLIDLSGEFNRSPRPAGDGSDHGWPGASVAWYSGAIQGPYVIGNIEKSPSTTYPGSWGYGAPVAGLGQQLNLAHFAATTAFLLRTPSPVSAVNSVLANQGGNIRPTIELAKIIP